MWIEDLCKLSKEYLNALTGKFCTFFVDKIVKLLTYQTPLSIFSLIE